MPQGSATSSVINPLGVSIELPPIDFVRSEIVKLESAHNCSDDSNELAAVNVVGEECNRRADERSHGYEEARSEPRLRPVHAMRQHRNKGRTCRGLHPYDRSHGVAHDLVEFRQQAPKG